MMLKKTFYALLAVAVSVTACVQDTLVEPAPELKEITVSAGISPDTKAAVSDEGKFAWQANDQISVLATDGKYYTLTLSAGAGSKQADFTGSLPEGVNITSIATYPAQVENGAVSEIFNADSKTLSYTLPAEYTCSEGNTNVPMVATFGEGATEIGFKHIGALVRIPLNGMPANSKVIVTVKDRGVTGTYAVPMDKVGSAEGAIAATVQEGTNSVVTFAYNSTVSGQTAEFNLPFPTGTYTDLTVSVKDQTDTEVYTRTYSLEGKVFKRANLLVLEADQVGPIGVNTVHPFFVDARVYWPKAKDAEAYALYVDDAETPVIVSPEELTEKDGLYSYMIGGAFKHNTVHNVALAVVKDGEPLAESKSSKYEFTTANVMQMTYNTGTKFVCAGWDDVAVGVENSTNFVNGKWTMVAKTSSTERDVRGYKVQLYAADKTTLLYDEVPFSGQCDYGGAIASSSWIGKVGGANVLLPTALTFGWLEPGQTYYFRVKTLDEPVVFNSPANGCFEPSTAGYTVSSPRGGCGWSEFVEMKTDPERVLGATEVFHEGFDDMMYNSDIMNMCSAAVPQLLTAATKKADYENRKSAEKLKTWLGSDFSQRKFSEQGFNTMLNNYEYGLTDDKYSNSTTPRYLNSYAGSLEGWSILSSKEDRNMYPNFGAVRLGQSGTNANGAELRTAPLNCEKLSADKATKCIVTVKVSATATTTTDVRTLINITQYRNDGVGLSKIDGISNHDFSLDEDGTVNSEWAENFTGSSETEYTHIPTWREVKTSFYLKNGDIIGFESPKGGSLGMLVIGDILIEIDPTGDASGVERFYGTAPDGTNYDVWGLNGPMPVTYWMGPPALNDATLASKTAEEQAAIKATYFDPLVEGGYNLLEVENTDPASMKIILDWCTEAGIKLLDKSMAPFGNWTAEYAPNHITRIANYVDHAAYAGAFVGYDEPGAKAFTMLDAVNDAYASAFPTKGRTINLFPGYANVHQLNCGNVTCDDDHSLASNMIDYVEYFGQTVSVSNMMFDHYCLSKSDKNGAASRGKVKSYQYSDLDLFRNVSLSKRIPFLMITHGRPQWDPGYSATIANNDPTWTTDVSATALPPKPDEHVYDEQRWLVWSQLALGSKGVSYFCYWTPYGFKGGPFSYHYDGTKTRMYDILKNINKEIQPIGQILMKCHADGAMMTNPTGYFALYENDAMGLPSYGPVLALERGNSEDVVAGCFRDATSGEYKVLVTHKAPATTDDEAATASIAKLTLDRSMVAKVKLHTVTLPTHNAAAQTVVTEENLTGETITLSIPDGTAVLVEFPETANKNYN